MPLLSHVATAARRMLSLHEYGVRLARMLDAVRPARSFRARLAITFGGAAFGFAVVSALVIGRLSASYIERDTGLLAAELAHQVADKLDRTLYERERDLALLAQWPAVLDSTVPLPIRRAELDRIRNFGLDFSWVGFTDTTGRVTLAAGGAQEGRDVSARPWFMQGRSAPFVSSIHEPSAQAMPFSRAGDATSLAGRHLDIAVPVVAANGRRMGVLGAYLDESWLTEVERSLSSSLRALGMDLQLFDADGRRLVASSRRRDTLPTALRPTELGIPAAPRMVRWNDGSDYLTVVVRSAGFRGFPGLGWYVVVRTPAAIAMQTPNLLRRTVLAGGVMIGLLFALLGWFLADRLTAPLAAVAYAAQRFQRGARHVTIPAVSGRDEVAQLASSLTAAVESVRDSENRLRLALGAARMGTWDWDIASGEISSTPDLAEAIGLPAGTLRFSVEGYLELVHPDDRSRVRAALKRAEENGEPYRIITRVVWPDGSVHWRQSWGDVVRDGDGRPLRVVGVGVDVTAQREADDERRALELQMQHAQKLESLGVLAGGIAHDFNNLLVGVLGNASLMLADLPPASPMRRTVQEIARAAERAAELTRQLLAYAGRGRLLVAPLDLSQLVTEMSTLLQSVVSKRAVVRSEVAPKLPLIQADATQVRQIVMNLITNASDALHDRDGSLSVRTGVIDADRAFLDATYFGADVMAGRYVFVEVADSGCGMDAETLERIFDPFFTTKFTGRGLGLAATLGIVRRHRGTLLVRSEPGKGSSFRILFPALAAAARATVIHEEPAGWRGRGMVMLVDDDPAVVGVASAMLERLGFRVCVAGDGKSALELFDRFAAEVVLVLLDLTMPQLDGAETLQALRARHSSVPVLVSSGYGREDVAMRLGAHERVSVMQKPFALCELQRAVREAIGAQ